MRNLGKMLLLLAGWTMSLACEHEMQNNARYKPLENHPFFENGQLARPPVPGTIPQGYLKEDELLHFGKMNGKFADVFPFPVTEKVLERGEERYNIYCSVCHDRAGYGKGMVVQRGFPAPASLHTEKLRNQPAGYFVDVMTRGFGRMASYARQIKPEDRWAVAAYIRALQFSQNARLQEIENPEIKKTLEEKR